MVHISSHFKVQSGDIARSFLVMGDGTPLSLAQMRDEAKKVPGAQLLAGVDLLTLSACETGISEPDGDGKEVDSFTELAQRFGAASVLSTLWAVNECSTAEFMRLFYENKITKKMNKAEAVRQAQLALLDGKAKTIAGCQGKGSNSSAKTDSASRDVREFKKYVQNPAKPYSHPYYWSPFVLYGNWK